MVDSGKPDWWFNAILAGSSSLFVITAPILGRRLDYSQKKLSGVRITTLITFLLFSGTAIVTLFAPTYVLSAALLYACGLYMYLLSFIYYTPMLNDISGTANRSFVSGLGTGANYAGQVIGLLITLPLATGAIYLFGATGRAQTLLPAAILFGILAAPLLFWFKDGPSQTRVGRESFREELSGVRNTLTLIFANKNLAFLLLAYFLFSDALLTFSNNFPLFLEKVHNASDSVKTYLTAGILSLSVIGAILGGSIADKKGGVRTLFWLLLSWVVLFPALAFAPSFSLVVVICLVAGIFFGPTWGVSRALVSEFSAKELSASSFSFFILMERFATFAGPIVWSIVLAATASQGARSYSYAIVGMGALVFISLFFIRRISPLILNSEPERHAE